MTCIVGLVAADGSVWIGADSAQTANWDLPPTNGEKMFAAGEFVIGHAGDTRMYGLLRYVFEPPAIETEDVTRYMVAQWVPALRTVLRDGGYLKTDSGQDQLDDTLLVGVRGRLYMIDSAFSVLPMPQYAAIGCGGDFALGCLAGGDKDDLPKHRIEWALLISERLSAGVRRPFTVLQVPT